MSAEQRHRCGGCPSRWTGASMAHCASCHETFSGVSTFDQHRARKYTTRAGRRVMVRDFGQCYDPASDGLVQNDRGTWGSPKADRRFTEARSEGNA